MTIPKDSKQNEPLDIFAGAPGGAPALPKDLDVDFDGIVDPEPKPKVRAPRVSQVQVTEEKTPEAASPGEIEIGSVNIDTPESDAAIDDIVAEEADKVLAAEDAGLRAAERQAQAHVVEPPAKNGHPIFWFLIFILVTLAFLTLYVMTSPGLELPFLAVAS